MLVRSRIALFFLTICLLFAALSLRPAHAQSASDAAVEVTATLVDNSQASPAKDSQIQLNWPVDPRATRYTISRKLATDPPNAPFIQIGIIDTMSDPTAAASTSFTDTRTVTMVGDQTVIRDVTVGTAYEYQVTKSSNVFAVGYAVSGIRVSLPGGGDGSRGKVILIVANTLADLKTPLAADPTVAARLNRLVQDLTGDGWTVITHNVDADAGINVAGIPLDHGAGVRAVKNIIRADYNADPANVKTVFLFGHVPVPYSGDIAPDGHGPGEGDHQGAWPADDYYADMGPEANWTDTTVNDTTAGDPRNYNVPGDGKFDNGRLPKEVELEVGRVDLSNLPSFAPKTERDLLAQYLDKDHNYRSGSLNLNPAGRIADNFGYFGGEAFAANGYRFFSNFFGPNAVTNSDGGALFGDLNLGNFLWTDGVGPGGPSGAGGVGNTGDFANPANDPHSVFYMLFGSFFGDWGYTDDFLRAPLGTPTYGLTCSWGGRPDQAYQHMALGFEIGYSMRLDQNRSSATHIALMGDPTLRENPIAPASGLNAVLVPGGVQLSWTGSSQVGTSELSPVRGYNVYRQDVPPGQTTPSGPFTLLTTVPAPGATGRLTPFTYLDPAAAGTLHVYQVRAATLQTTPTGTYFNQSEGIFQGFDQTHAAPTVTLVSPVKSDADPIPTLMGAPGAGYATATNGQITLTIAAQATSSIPNDPGLTVTFYRNATKLGSVSTVPYQFQTTLGPGYYQISAVATDGQGATVSSNMLPVYVFKNDGDLAIYQGALGTGYTDRSDKSNDQMTDDFGGGKISVTLKKPGSAFILSHVPIDTSLYTNLTLHFQIAGGAADNDPGGQMVMVSVPRQETTGTMVVIASGGNQRYSDDIKIPIAGVVGAGEPGLNMDGIIFQDANRNLDKTGKPVALPTFYIKNVFLSYKAIRGNRPAGVAIHLDQPKFIVNSTPIYTVASQATQPIIGKGDAATPDGAVVEVDLSLNGAYYGRALGQGADPLQRYSPFQTNLPVLAPGVYTLQASAVTSFGAVSSSDTSLPGAKFIVAAAPTVAITAPADKSPVALGTPFTITAVPTPDPNATIVKVDFFANGKPVGTATTAPYTASFTPPSTGAFILTATATDNAGGVGSSPPITVNAFNPPTVAITAPVNNAILAAPATFPFTVNATAGDNPVTKVDFFANGNLLGTVTTAPYTINLNKIGSGTFTLTAVATDTVGLTSTSPAVSIRVANPPAITLTTPADGAVLVAPASFAVTATPTQGEGAITKVDFFANGKPIGTATTSPYTVSQASLPVGSYAFTAVVTDTLGLTATSPAVTVAVAAPPTITISAPANNALFGAPATIPVTATPTPGTNPIAKVDFFVNGNPSGTVTKAPYTFSLTNVGVGTFKLTAMVTDTVGLTATSALVTVNVINPPKINITAPVNGAVTLAPATFLFTASVTQGLNPIAQVEFFSNGKSLKVFKAAPYTLSLNNVGAGTFNLTAVVTDSAGLAITSAPVTITVATPPTVSITAPAASSVFVMPAPVPISASVTAGSNPIAKVDFFQSADAGKTTTLIGTATTAPYTVSAAGLAAGTYALTAVVTDSVGLTVTSAPVSIVVATPPTVSITSPANAVAFAVPGTFPITVNAAAGSNPITKVDFFDGAALIGTSVTAPYTFNVTGLAVGSHTLTAKVTDSIGLTATSAPITITVANPPTATITAPKEGAIFATSTAISIAANAAAGSNPVAKVDFFQSSDAGKTTTLIGTATAAPYTVSTSTLASGAYALTAVVTDSIGLTATSATVNITVANPPTAAISAPVDGAIFATSAPVTITATATQGDNPITKVDFFAGAALIGTATAAPYTVSTSSLASGTYALTAVVTDSIGLAATSAPVNITVAKPPAIAIAAPAGGTVFALPTTLAITTTTVAGDNPITKVDFLANGKPIGTATAAPFSLSTSGLTAGAYALTAVATDSLGLTTTSAPVSVTLANPPTAIITTPTNGTAFAAPAPVTITATATQGDNVIAKVDFFANGKSIGTATTAPYTISTSSLAAGAYTLTAVVTDSIGLTASAPAVTITVAKTATVAITAPTTGAIFAAPATVLITAAVTPGDNPVTKVDFFANGRPVGTATTAPYTVRATGLATGTYALTAVVTDSLGLTTTAAGINITVQKPPSVSTTAPAAGAVFAAPAAFPFTANPAPGANPITKVDFFANGAPLGTATTAPYTINVTGLAAGTYALTSVATDSAGLTTTSAPITITVSAPPAVAITTPAAGTIVGAPATVSVTATVVMGGNPIAKVDFFVNGKVVGSAATAPYTVSVPSLTAGVYTLTAVATDSAGLTVTSAPVTLTVNAPPTIAITAPIGGSSFAAPATISVTATAKVGSSPIAQVVFFANGQPFGTATSAPYTASASGLAAGAYVLTAVATDINGLTSTSAAVNVTVITPLPVYGLVTRSFDSRTVTTATVSFTNQATNQVTTVPAGAATTGPDGKSANYTLTSLGTGGYVVAASAPGYISSASQTIQVTLGQPLRVNLVLLPLHAFDSGLQMFSIPYDYTASGLSLSAILALPVPKVVGWDPTVPGYTVPSTFKNGQGYWGYFPVGANLIAQGVPAPTSKPFTSALSAGWNIISDPFLTSVAINGLQIAGADGVAKPLSSALASSLIGPNLYTYNMGSKAYDSRSLASGGTLDPYAGYWIYVSGNATLIVPAPAATASVRH